MQGTDLLVGSLKSKRFSKVVIEAGNILTGTVNWMKDSKVGNNKRAKENKKTMNSRIAIIINNLIEAIDI